MLGRPLRLSVQDTQGGPKAAFAAYRRVVGEEKAVAVTGFFHSSVNIAANEVAKGIGIRTIGTQTSAADITAKHYRYRVSDPCDRSDPGLGVADFMRSKGFKRVSIMAETSDYGIGLVEETTARPRKRSSDRVADDHLRSVLDRPHPQLLQVKAFKPDLVVNIGVGQPMDLMIDQATTLGIMPSGADAGLLRRAYSRPQFWQFTRNNGNGSTSSPTTRRSRSCPTSASGSPRPTRENTKRMPVYVSLNGFGDVAIMAQAVQQAKSADPKARDPAARDRQVPELAARRRDLPEGRRRVLGTTGRLQC